MNIQFFEYTLGGAADIADKIRQEPMAISMPLCRR